jgi:hypothetical protein
MKTPSFYQTIIATLIAVMALAAIGLIASCDLIPAIAPDDFAPWHGTHQDSIATDPIDTIGNDTIPTDTLIIDTCTELIEYTEPAFVVAWMDITDDLFTDRTVIIGNHSFIWAQDLPNVAGLIDSLWELYRPEYSYQTIISDNDSRKLMTIIKGTNDRQQFYLKAQIRYNGFKHYFGFATQEIIFAAPLTAEQYIDLIDQYPSIARWGFYGTDYSDQDYIKVCEKILDDCRAGRELADLRHQTFEIPDTIINKLEDAGWNTILN